MRNTQKHIPVLVQEVLYYLDVKPKELYVDVTLGGGGHTRAILEQNKSCKVIGIDWDKSVIDSTGKQLQEEYPNRFFPVWGNFSKVYQLIQKAGFSQVHGILADFGTSQIQINNSPGLSVYKDSFLDMRLSSAHFKTTAYDVINTFSEKALADIFYTYADERYGRKIAQAIVLERKQKKIKTTTELAALIERIVPHTHRTIHPATKVFQALRIFVNKELENIESFLINTTQILAHGGRLVCISFHSLEDRRVKQFLKNRNKLSFPQAYYEILTKNVCVALPAELEQNKSARSARLRAAILQKSI